MNQLTSRERELVALGAAMGSNCVPCIEHHIQLSRKLDLSDLEIREAIELADKVRLVPAHDVLVAATNALEGTSDAKTCLPDAAQCACVGQRGARCC